jgi:hypothetical protein
MSAALALLTPVAANAQETNSFAPAVNAPEAVIFSKDESQLDGMSVEDLNALQLARLEQKAFDRADETGTAPVIANKDADPVFTTQGEAALPDDDKDVTAMGGPDYESEEDAMSDRYMKDDPAGEEPAEAWPEGAPYQPAEDPLSEPLDE